MRFRYRHVHATMADYIKTGLVGLGWGDASVDPNAAVNFGTVPLTYIEVQPLVVGQPIADNTVAVSLGDEPHGADQEMGDGLKAVDFPLFVDIFGVDQSISQAIASDVKDLLEDHYQQVMDHADDPPTSTNEQIECDKDDVMVVQPQAALEATDIRKQWRVVKTIARVYYTAVV